jgi:cellulose synthase/poly-beta-1,6-N-acetylglucosamine synthase-like glycosyltransferase
MVAIEPWVVITAISLGFSIPVLLSSYYTVILFISSLRYPKSMAMVEHRPQDTPTVSVLIATYNEKFVIAKTLDAITRLNYPKGRLQIIVADDSTDETRELIDRKIAELNSSGFATFASRRDTRDGFKSGALNQAAKSLAGDYVLLLDADSMVTSEVLSRGLPLFKLDPKIAFVSFRVGHYNREQNLITRLFALQLDQGDTINKMGSYSIDAPFSFQGGFTLISTAALKRVGFWTNDSIVDDADLSCKIYSVGLRGVYLSDVRIFSEDPSSLEIWKKQATRVAQGWAKCAASNWRKIIRSNSLSLWKRLAILISLLGPFSALSWIVVTFVSAVALALGVTAPGNSIFSNPFYLVIITIPAVSFFVSGAYALHVQKIMTPRNLTLLPVISYTSSGLMTSISVGFLNGIRGKHGSFFRTPKSGIEDKENSKQYFRDIPFGRIAVIESIIAILAIALSTIALTKGVWFLFLSLLGFGALTLKSVNLNRLFRRPSQSHSIIGGGPPRKIFLPDSRSQEQQRREC